MSFKENMLSAGTEVRRTGSVNLDREPHSICGPKGLSSQCHHVAPVLDVARTFQNYFCLLRIWVLLNHTTPARFSPKCAAGKNNFEMYGPHPALAQHGGIDY